MRPDSISKLLHEPMPRMTRRIAVDAAKFAVAVSAIEVGCLKTRGVEMNPDATAGPGNLLGLHEQARTDSLATVRFRDAQHIDRAPRPIGLPSHPALYFAGSVTREQPQGHVLRRTDMPGVVCIEQCIQRR